MQDYVVHPSFTNGTNNHFMNGEWDKEITGYWVAKYAAGFQTSATDASNAILETSTTGSDSTSLNRDYSFFPYTSDPFFQRGFVA